MKKIELASIQIAYINSVQITLQFSNFQYTSIVLLLG